MQDDWLESMAQETLCCMCARKPGTSDETARKLRRSIVNGRLETGKPVLLLDWDGDVLSEVKNGKRTYYENETVRIPPSALT